MKMKEKREEGKKRKRYTYANTCKTKECPCDNYSDKGYESTLCVRGNVTARVFVATFFIVEFLSIPIESLQDLLRPRFC